MTPAVIVIENLPLGGAFIIKPKEFYDERGTFIKIYDRAILKTKGVEPVFPEDYLSISKKGVVRGMHYQLEPYAQAKLVRVVTGSSFDVIVDMRRSSPTFGKWISVTLSDENRLALFVPRGFAHGFLSLKDDTQVSYKADNDYEPAHERGVLWNDKALGIEWPKMNYIISSKDKSWPSFEQADKFD